MNLKYRSEKHAVEAFIKAMPASWHIQRIETNITSGVPDLSIAIPHVGLKQRDRCEFWVEVKHGSKAELRPFQVAWWLRRVNAGGRVWIIWIQKDDIQMYNANKDMFDKIERMKAPRLIELNAHTHAQTWELVQRTLEYYT